MRLTLRGVASVIVILALTGRAAAQVIPAQGDPIPYFTLQSSGGNHVGEMLTIIISPKPLPAPVSGVALDPATVAQWERMCGGQTERRESRGPHRKPPSPETAQVDWADRIHDRRTRSAWARGRSRRDRPVACQCR